MADTSTEHDLDDGHFLDSTVLRSGTIFWAALKHPYHEDTYMRLYLVVSCKKTATGQVGLAIVGLETNGGHGSDCYTPDSQQYLKEVVDYTKKLEEHPQYLCLSETESYALQLKGRTVIDLTTVLVVESPDQRLECRPVGHLTGNSMNKVFECFAALGKLPDYYDRMTTRTPKEYPKGAAPQRKGAPIQDCSDAYVTIFNPEYYYGYWGLVSKPDFFGFPRETETPDYSFIFEGRNIEGPWVMSSKEPEAVAKRFSLGLNEKGYKYVAKPRARNGDFRWEPRE